MKTIENKLYRDSKEGVVSGVLAGIADSYRISPWLLRIAFVLLLFMGLFPLAFAYIALCFVLPQKTPVESSKLDTLQRKKLEKSASYQMRRANQILNRCLNRTNKLESYMVSSRYNLDREYRKLESEPPNA